MVPLRKEPGFWSQRLFECLHQLGTSLFPFLLNYSRLLLKITMCLGQFCLRGEIRVKKSVASPFRPQRTMRTQTDGRQSPGATQGLVVYPCGKQIPPSGGWWSQGWRWRGKTKGHEGGWGPTLCPCVYKQTDCIHEYVTVRWIFTELSKEILQLYTTLMFVFIYQCLVYELAINPSLHLLVWWVTGEQERATEQGVIH